MWPATVPFVGCKSDGQVGPVDAPKGTVKELPISAEAARELAYYEAQGLAVLAPRGWYCFGVYGSGGEALVVGPARIEYQPFFAEGGGFAGSGVELFRRWGSTSGRFDVAEVIARVFPAYIAFTKSVDADFDRQSPRGPYAHDKVTYKAKNIVEFQTPPNTEGLGTRSWLKKNDQPISGVAMLVGKDPDLLQLSLRLPPDLQHLTQVIIQQLERDATG